jgi:hypothetical protein
MNIALRTLMSATVILGFVAFGWLGGMFFVFATESRALSDFPVRNGKWILGLILGVPTIIGICSATVIFREKKPGMIAMLVFALALCGLIAVSYIYLRSA